MTNDHLKTVPDDCGCIELAEHLSEKRQDHATDCPGPPECKDASYCTPQRF